MLLPNQVYSYSISAFQPVTKCKSLLFNFNKKHFTTNIPHFMMGYFQNIYVAFHFFDDGIIFPSNENKGQSDHSNVRDKAILLVCSHVVNVVCSIVVSG